MCNGIRSIRRLPEVPQVAWRISPRGARQYPLRQALTRWKAEVLRAAREAFAHDFIVGRSSAYDTIVGEQGNQASRAVSVSASPLRGRW
jgi:hypothetical protein